MSSIVPRRPDGAVTLADVVPSCLATLAGAPNALSLPPARSAVVLLVDGLGSSSLAQRKGHARTLTGVKGSLWSGFPSTTAAALATLTTGAAPGEHGLVGFTVLDPDNDRVVKQLSGWDALMTPDRWPRRRPLFESAPAGLVHAVGAKRYRSSGLTHAILSGADYVVAETLGERVDRALDLVTRPEPALVYLYVPELDMAAHRLGWQSPEWTALLEDLDGEVRRLEAALPRDVGLLVTADHGMVDVPEHRRLVFGQQADLVAGVRHVAGDPRVLQLHLEPDATPEHRGALVEAWRRAEGERAWVVTREEAVAAGWFGPVDPVVAPRIGDVLVAARKSVAWWDGRSTGGAPGDMVGHHGSWSDDETRVPLLRFGAYSA
ncbi:alkaline phosphatase family protein [Frigoribacterium salinisoli]